MSDPEIGVTTTEELHNKPLVQPYAEAPVLDLARGAMVCGFCGSTVFRRSRLRVHDLRELFLLRYPVRCTRCSQRQYNDYAVGFLALPPKEHGPKLDSGSDTWASWTKKHGASRSPHPRSTAVGRRAQDRGPATRPARRTPPAVTPPPNNNDIW